MLTGLGGKWPAPEETERRESSMYEGRLDRVCFGQQCLVQLIGL